MRSDIPRKTTNAQTLKESVRRVAAQITTQINVAVAGGNCAFCECGFLSPAENGKTILKHNFDRTLVAAARGTSFCRWISGEVVFVSNLQTLPPDAQFSNHSDIMNLRVHRGARVKHTKTHSTSFLNTQLKNVAVPKGFVRSAKQLLRNMFAASPLKLQHTHKCRCGCDKCAFCEGGFLSAAENGAVQNNF